MKKIPLIILALDKHERIDNNCKNQVHQVEPSNYNYPHAIHCSYVLYATVHEIEHNDCPVVKGYDLEDCPQRNSNVIKGLNSE